jgi:hypothetical protein
MAENGRGEAERRCASPHAGDGEPTAARARAHQWIVPEAIGAAKIPKRALERADRLCVGQNQATPWSAPQAADGGWADFTMIWRQVRRGESVDDALIIF